MNSCNTGPELISMGLLNPCDLKCPLCYAPKSPHRLEPEFVIDVCRQFAKIGTSGSSEHTDGD